MSCSNLTVRTRTLIAGTVGLALTASSVLAMFQPSSGTPRPAPVQAVPYEPIVLRVAADAQEWTLNGEILLLSLTRDDTNTPSRPVAQTYPIKLDAAVITYPIPTDTAYTVIDDSMTESKLKVGNTEVQGPPRMLDGYQSEQRLLAWDVVGIDAKSIRLDVKTSQRAFKTVIDEERAFAVDWPKGELPESLNSSLGAQMYIEADAPEIKRLVEVWTNGNAKRVKPYYLAKFLAAKVIDWYQPSEGPYLSQRDSDIYRTHSGAVMIAGYNVRGAVFAAREQEGSNLDMANLLCAVYRAAGIPARVVIGYDHEAQREANRPPVTAWVEFFLMVDEENQRGEWVPVDIIRQREFSSRAPDVTRQWKYFGNSDLSQNYSVISFHWHPPTTVVNSGPPAFWGWLPKPSAPNVDQGVRFHAFATPTTAERQRKQREGR
ncbi:MAG: transglutaminase-like domain-containing protein [Phycisphaerales bacterium JB050]